MKFYIAARFQNYVEARKVARLLRSMGHQVTSQWHDRAGDSKLWRDNRTEANQDLSEIRDCDMLLQLTHTRAAGYTTGGSHVEFGYALASGKKLGILGPKESVFHDVEQALQFQSPGDLSRWLTGQEGAA